MLSLNDLSYTIFFFGFDNYGTQTLKKRLKSRYDPKFLDRLILYLQLKIKRNNKSQTYDKRWKELNFLDKADLEEGISLLLEEREKSEPLPVPYIEPINFFSTNFRFTKYYGGHQHRLSHYFRHLFQTYEFLESQHFLSTKKKYEYGKILRSQLSTFEQYLLVYNTISELGWKWELKSEEGNELVTFYRLIKNIPDVEDLGGNNSAYYQNLKF